MREIIQMLKFGRAFSVQLACGHKFRATVDEAKREQLCIGKPVACQECQNGR